MVWKLDRIGRDLRHLVNLVGDLTKREIGLRVLAREGASINTNGRLVSAIFAELVEFERELIVERTKAGIAAARARGRPFKVTPAKLRLAYVAMGKPQTKIAELGIPRQTFYRFAGPKGELRSDGQRLLDRCKAK